MPECVDLTLDSDEECPPPGDRKRRLPSPDSDVVLVDVADQQPKRQRPAAAAEEQDEDVVLESATGTVALKDMAHARLQCGNFAFRQSTCRDNSSRCEQCYCFVCDIKAADCQYWGDGSRARDHCNGHPSHYWNSLRKAARKGSSSAALLQQEFSNNSSTLSTNWTLPGSSSNHNRRPSSGGGLRGVMSPLAALWGRKAAETTARTPPAPAAAAAAGAAGGGSTPAAAAAAAAGGGGSTPAAAAAAAAGGTVARVSQVTGVKVEGSAKQQQQQQKQHKPAPRPRPALPPASSWLKRMPHPAQLKSPTQLLVRLELPFKTVKGVSVDEVAQRLVPCGFYKDASKQYGVQYGEHLTLDNITNGQYVMEKRKEVPLTLRLLPLVPADGLPVEPDSSRAYRFTVISTTPGVKPLALGVEAPLGCKLSKVKAALEGALAPHGYSSSREGLLLALLSRGVADDAPLSSASRGEGHLTWFKDTEGTRLNDQAEYTNRHNTWLAVRVPAELAKDYYKPSNGWSSEPPKILFLQHEQYEPLAAGADAREPSPSDDEYDSDEDEELLMCMDSDDSEDVLRLMQARTTRALQRRERRQAAAVHEVTELGPPMAVVVPEGMPLTGGPAADKALKEAIVAHLVHYRAAGGPQVSKALSSWEHLKVYKISGANRQRMTHSLYSTPARDFSLPQMEALYAPHNTPAARLWVHWGTAPVAAPPGFDLPAFTAQPELRDEAFNQKLAGLPDLLKAARAYDAAMKMLRGMPSEIIRELQSACACSVPPTANTPEQLSRVSHRPSAAAVLKVIKAPGSSSSKAGSSKAGSSKGGSSKGAAATEVAAQGSSAAAAIEAAAARAAAKGKSAELARLGVLQIEVYVFTTTGRLHTRLFEDYDDWGSAVTGRPGRFRGTTCQLASVLNARLLQEAGGYCLLKEITALGAEHKPVQGIAKLMDWVAAGERPPAVQPPGLTVTLHPYQLQSLAFMQQAEQAEGGWRDLLWRWLPPAPQQQQQQLAGPSSSAAAAAGAGGGAGGAGGGGGVVASRPGEGPGVWWSPVLGRVSGSVPAQPWGGFLAEEMGLGKTVEVLALILSNPPPPSVVAGRVDPVSRAVVSRGTLVVCAVSLVGQWCSEAGKKLNGSLKMYPYHGQNRIRDKHRLATEFDIVVTTYATLASDYGGKRNTGKTDSPLGGIKWHRIVFDEGHTVKNMSAAHSKACTALVSDRRWICTGTPINNDISDLLGQFSALHMQPFATKSYFDAYVKHAFSSTGYGISAVPLLFTLRHTMIRHTKAQTIQGQSVLALPDKSEELVPVVLSQAEREAYLRVHGEAAEVWSAVRGLAANVINQKLLQVMSLLQPLRRICSGGRLTPQDLRLPSELLLEATAAHAAAQEAAAAMFNPGGAAAAAAGGGGRSLQVQEDCTISVPDLECPICLDAFETPVMTLCHHWYCKECILGVLSSNPHCPLCRGPVTRADLRAPGKKPEPAPKKKRRRSKSSAGSDSEGGSESEDEGEEEEEGAGAGAEGGAAAGPSTRRGTRTSGDGEAVVCESKLRALLAELTAMRAADPSSKALVFSQYSSTLEWLKQRLPEEGFGYRTITGSMPLKQRAKAIEAFQGDPPTTVFLLSIRSGAVGINLTAANHVFLLEPCINPALEEQAIGRAWRMGQTRPVVVKRFYVKGSIEERIMDVRNIRQGHATQAAGAGTGAGGAATAAAAAASAPSPVAPGRMGRKKVAAAELAGNLQADRQVLKIAELDLLFRTPELERAAAAATAGAAAAAAAAAGGAGGGDGAGSSRQAEQAAAAAAAGAGGEQQEPEQRQRGATPAAAAGADAADGTGGAPVDPAAAAAAAAAGGDGGGQPDSDAAAAAAGGAGEGGEGDGGGEDGEAAAAAAAAAAGGGGGADDLPPLPGSQEARALAEAAGLQSSQEMTPYLLAQLQQQQRAWQLFEQMQQQPE